MEASIHSPQLTKARRRCSLALLLRLAKDLFLASFPAARSNCSWLTTAGTSATKIHSSSGSGSEEWIFVAEVPAVVSQEQFDLAAGKLAKNKSFARRNNNANEHLLRALVSCGECMLASIAVAKTFGKNNDRKQRYYVCSGKFNKAQSTPEEKCASRYAPAEQLDEIVWKDLCEVLSHPESITEALRRAHGGQWLPQELKARQENLRQGRAALGRQLERLTEAHLAEVIPFAEYQRRRKGLE